MENNKYDQFGYKTEHKIKYGSTGHCGTGAKIHMLSVIEIIDIDPNIEHGRNTYGYNFDAKKTAGKPVYFSIRAYCSGNGQNTARIYEHLNADDVTCLKCRKRLNLN